MTPFLFFFFPCFVDRRRERGRPNLFFLFSVLVKGGGGATQFLFFLSPALMKGDGKGDKHHFLNSTLIKEFVTMMMGHWGQSDDINVEGGRKTSPTAAEALLLLPEAVPGAIVRAHKFSSSYYLTHTTV